MKKIRCFIFIVVFVEGILEWAIIKKRILFQPSNLMFNLINFIYYLFTTGIGFLLACAFLLLKLCKKILMQINIDEKLFGEEKTFVNNDLLLEIFQFCKFRTVETNFCLVNRRWSGIGQWHCQNRAHRIPRSPPLLTLENAQAESEELDKLEGSALLKRLLEVRLPVWLSPDASCTDCDEEYLLTGCCFTLVAIPKKAIANKNDEELGKMGENNKNGAPIMKNESTENVEDPNNIANKYDFLLAVGNGKYFKIVDDAYFGKFGMYGGEFTCEARWLRTGEDGRPEPGFVYSFLPQPPVDAAKNDDSDTIINSFIIQSHANGHYLGPSENNVLCADYETIEEATKFALVCEI